MKTTYSLVTAGIAVVMLGHAATAQTRAGALASPLHHGRQGQPSLVHHVVDPSRGTAPVNDECANALPIAVVGLADCGTSATAGDNGTAVTSAEVPSCDQSTAGVQDVWYSFNSGAATNIIITLTPDASMTDWVFAVYQGCGGAELACEIVPAGGVAVTTQANTDYVIQVYSNLDWGVGGTFTLCVAADDSPVPPNDLCSSVTPENLAIGSPLTFTGTTAGATADGDFAQPDVNTTGAVWHAITITDACVDLTIDFCGTTPAFTNGYGIIGNSCPVDTATEILFTSADAATCPDGNFTIHYFGVPAGTYYLPVWSEVGVAYGPYTMNVSAATCAQPPANNDCASAIALTPGSACVPTPGTTFLATETQPADSCNGFLGSANDDVWYMFTATATDMTIGVVGDGTFDAVVELFEGACGAFTEIDCADATVGGEIEEIQHSGFNVGQTYYVRLFNFGVAAPTLSTFNICVTEGLGSGIGYTEHQAPIAWSVFPNPGNGELNIAYGDTPGRASIEVIDMAGRTIHSEVLNLTSGGRSMLNLSDRLAAGSYSVRITTAAGSNSQRVIVR